MNRIKLIFIYIVLMLNFPLLADEIDIVDKELKKNPDFKNLEENLTQYDIIFNKTFQDNKNENPEPPKEEPLTTNENDLTDDYTKVSLIDVVLETISNNNNVKVAREKVIQANLSLNDSYSGYKPTLDLEYKNGQNIKNPGEEGPASSTHKYDDITMKVFLSQNLYAGGATQNNVDSLKKNLESLKNRYKLVVSQEIQKATKAYFDVVFTYKSLRVTEKNMQMLKKILEIVNTKYELGAASIGDLSSIKASVSNAQSKLFITNSKFIESLKYYEYIVGEDFKYTLPYEYEYDIQIDSPEEILKHADEHNLNIVSYLLTIESEKYKLKGSRSNFKPKVDFDYVYTRSFGRDLDPEDFYIQNTNEFFITVSYNLYKGNKDSNAIASIYSKIRELTYKLAEERRKVKWIVSNSIQSLSALGGSIRSIEEEVKSNKTTVESYWETFKNGEQDLQTLLLAQRQLNTAEISYIESYQSKLRSYFQLLFETGDLVNYFNLDPTQKEFIDFTKSKYENIHADAPQWTELAKTDVDSNETDETKDSNLTKQVSVIIDTMQDTLVFKDKFLDANDEDYTILIKSFESIYETFEYIKENNLTKETFMIDTVENYKLRNVMACGIYDSLDTAISSLDAMKKEEDKEYEIVSLENIKDIYKKSLDKLDELKPKKIIKVQTVKLVPKPPKPYFTNEDFKKKFMDANKSSYTINLVTFSNLDDAISLVNEEKINNESFLYRYGNNAEWIKVVYGVFDNYEEAQLALMNLSSKTKERYYPVVEQISDKQELFDKYNTLELGVPLLNSGEVEYMKMDAKSSKSDKEQ